MLALPAATTDETPETATEPSEARVVPELLAQAPTPAAQPDEGQAPLE